MVKQSIGIYLYKLHPKPVIPKCALLLPCLTAVLTWSTLIFSKCVGCHSFPILVNPDPLLSIQGPPHSKATHVYTSLLCLPGGAFATGRQEPSFSHQSHGHGSWNDLERDKVPPTNEEYLFLRSLYSHSLWRAAAKSLRETAHHLRLGDHHSQQFCWYKLVCWITWCSDRSTGSFYAIIQSEME